MNKRVTFTCMSCEDINKNLLGTDNFIVKETEFDTLTSAVEHILDYGYNHYIVAQVQENE